MPCLPSGLHFAINPLPLSQLVERAFQGELVHELMAIKDCSDIFRHIDILYFKPKVEDLREYQYAAGSIPRPEGLEPYPSGFTLLLISREVKNWSEADLSAFINFLNEERTKEYFESLIRSVEDAQKTLLSNPRTLPGLLATWWKLGCHPMQEEEGETGGMKSAGHLAKRLIWRGFNDGSASMASEPMGRHEVVELIENGRFVFIQHIAASDWTSVIRPRKIEMTQQAGLNDLKSTGRTAGVKLCL